MPFLGFTTTRTTSTSPARDASSLKDSLRKITQKGPSSVSLRSANVQDDAHMDSLKRHSFTGKPKPARRGSQPSPTLAPKRPARLWLTVESPPLVCYNSSTASSGALFSAQLHVDVTDAEAVFESIHVQFICQVTVKKPVHPGCAQCTSKTSELADINLNKNQILTLKRGDHPIPVSYLFPGHLPATTQCGLGRVEYFLVASAKLVTGETITLSQRGPNGDVVAMPGGKHPIKLYRSIMSGAEKTSVRIFPPTNLTATVTLQPHIHPIGQFKVEMRLSGMNHTKGEQINRWRLRKLNWRIEELTQMVSPACPKHSLKLGGEGKGIQHEHVDKVGEGNLDPNSNPWKTDVVAGDLEAEFMCSVNPAKKPACDAEAQNGLKVSHCLVLEMVVAEEWSPKSKPSQVTPSGAARILRAQFNLCLTERPGLGVSWDEETPPVYEDVPESPPHYASNIEFDWNTMAGQIEDLHLDPNTNQIVSSGASSSRTRPSSSRTSSADQLPTRSRLVLNVDDLLSAPADRPASVQEEDEQEEDEQGYVQVAHSSSASTRH